MGNGILRAYVASSTPTGWVRRLPRPERTTKPMSPQNDRFRLFNIPNPQKKSQKKNSTVWSIPTPAKPTVPSSKSRKAKLEQNFHQPQQQPQPWTQRMTEQINWYLIVHWNPQSKLRRNNKLNYAESELSKRETREKLLGADIATDQTKPFNNDVSPRKVFRSNHRRRVAPSDPSLIKPSNQIQVVRPEKPKRGKTSINPNICLNLDPKDDRT